jgi:hypothetical protein
MLMVDAFGTEPVAEFLEMLFERLGQYPVDENARQNANEVH